MFMCIYIYIERERYMKALDKSVAEATENRKEENAEYKDLNNTNK